MNELVLKIEENVTPQISAQIQKTFEPMVKMLAEFETRYDEIVASEITQDTCTKAKRLRLDIAKVRTTTENVRKAEKEEHLRAGKAIDGVANILKFAVTKKEEKLEEIEKHFETIEAERIAKLAQDRAIELMAYECENVAGLGTMDEMVYANFLTGAKINFENKKESERKAEEERLRLIEVEKLHNQRKELLLPVWNFVPENKRNDNFGNLSELEWNERLNWTLNEKKLEDERQEKIIIENELLKKEAEEKEKQRKEEVRIAEEKLKAELAKAEAERKAIEEKNRIERERVYAEAKKLKAEQDAILEKERAERAKIEAELKAQKEADKMAEYKILAIEKEKLLAEKKAKSAPDKTKLENLANSFDTFILPDVNSEEAVKTINDVRGLLANVSAFIRQRNEQI